LALDDIIAGCKAADNAARRELYERYSGLILSVLCRYVRDRATAEDLLHDVFITIFTKIGDYSGRGSFEGWCKRIAVNKALNIYRSSDPLSAPVAVDDVPALVSEDASAVESLSADELLAAIERLPHGFRTVLNLFAVEGYSHHEIAAMLGISEATSRSQYWRARNRLIEILKSEHYDLNIKGA